MNEKWQDITVVYGLLNQNKDTSFVKITKAFLGEGNALAFAKIPDSSTYPDKLDVKLEEYYEVSMGTPVLKNTYTFDTLTIANKQPGDSIFYYPYQLVYFTKNKLKKDNSDTTFFYKLNIAEKKTGKIITAKTPLVNPMTVSKPQKGNTVTILPNHSISLEFYTSKNGRRYQLLIRLHYSEYSSVDTVSKTVDWIVFNNLLSNSLSGGEQKPDPNVTFFGNGLYSAMKSQIPVNPNVTRHANYVDYLFTVAGDDLNTYMNVTAPSNTIIQERPTYSNITNGIGLFSTIMTTRIDSLRVSQVMRDSLKTNQFTKDLNF
ncbi:MAG: hypothetical protein NTX61_16975 [Bacteroidetes bacterium]|nr:hypothetical protein [Bacteroidota bacterium]